MSSNLTVAEVFDAAGLTPCGPVPWDTLLEEKGAGVYVLSLAPEVNARSGTANISKLPPEVLSKWLENQPVVYIGRTRRSLASPA